MSVKTLQRLAEKCVSFARAVPAAKLFTREMNTAISRGLHSQKPILLRGALREEIAHWLLLENWENVKPIWWRDERDIQISMATDSSSSGWGVTTVSPGRREPLGYWTQEEFTWDIVTKKDMAINKILLSCSDEVCTPACRCTG